jgi:hypothetical protein
MSCRAGDTRKKLSIQLAMQCVLDSTYFPVSPHPFCRRVVGIFTDCSRKMRRFNGRKKNGALLSHSCLLKLYGPKLCIYETAKTSPSISWMQKAYANTHGGHIVPYMFKKVT